MKSNTLLCDMCNGPALQLPGNLIAEWVAAKVFKQTSVFTVNSAAANNESLLAGDVLGADEDVVDCFDPDGLLATSDDDQCNAWGPWSNGYSSDHALSRRQRDRCLSHGTDAHLRQPAATDSATGGE